MKNTEKRTVSAFYTDVLGDTVITIPETAFICPAAFSKQKGRVSLTICLSLCCLLVVISLSLFPPRYQLDLPKIAYAQAVPVESYLNIDQYSLVEDCLIASTDNIKKELIGPLHFLFGSMRGGLPILTKGYLYGTTQDGILLQSPLHNTVYIQGTNNKIPTHLHDSFLYLQTLIKEQPALLSSYGGVFIKENRLILCLCDLNEQLQNSWIDMLDAYRDDFCFQNVEKNEDTLLSYANELCSEIRSLGATPLNTAVYASKNGLIIAVRISESFQEMKKLERLCIQADCPLMLVFL